MAASAQTRFATESSVKGPRATAVLDEAVSLFRRTPLSILSVYYLGALPFCLGLIYFWFDMTQGADAEAHLVAEALALTGFYLWMKTCQAVFARRLLALVEGEDTEPWDLRRWANTLLIQAVYAGSLVLVYPIAMIITIPFGWVSAFYHNISIFGTSSESTLQSSYAEAADLARLWPKQNHLIIGITLVASLVLFLNFAVFFMMIPELLNTFFGIETIFEENSLAWNNSSFYLDVSVFCFLVLNPLNKAIYVLRCFYGRARLNGADLKSALWRYQAARTAQMPVRTLALILVLFWGAAGSHARAETDATGAAPPKISAPADSSAVRLDQAIEKTLQKDEFAWRLPRTAPGGDGNNWVYRIMRSVFDFFKNTLRTPLKWLGKLIRWLLDRDQKHESNSSWWQGISEVPWRLIFVFLALIVLVIVVLWCLRYLRRQAPQTLTPLTAAAVRTVDLQAEDVRADDLPEDSWLSLAQQMIERGEMRLALRAFYLATLSVLAQRQLVRLGAAKSNRDYLLELSRRLRGDISFLGFFRENVGLFEASWYGTHEVTAAMIDTMRANHQHMRSYAAP
ncbi:MAG TPA: DUF4129 domain-containing protein [Candidatus Methylacidiphilales bacterium]|nr:DUF4129 domain-containing protein [Candidatus Methylacidiphilales bacterium]